MLWLLVIGYLQERLTNRVYHLEQELERTNKYCSELIQQKDAELERLHDNVKHSMFIGLLFK